MKNPPMSSPPLHRCSADPGRHRSAQVTGMDALSEVLGSVRVTSALFFSAEFTAPWRAAAFSIEELASTVLPGCECLVMYHLITAGRARIHVDGLDEVLLTAGDIVIISQGDAHTMSSDPPPVSAVAPPVDSAMVVRKVRAGDLSVTQAGGGGAVTRYVCGFFGCERQATRLFLAGLPRLLKINIRGDARGEWLESSIRYLVSEASSSGQGRSALLSKMAEALFVETLRRYVDQAPPGQTCWLAGACDSIVGGALSLLHRKPWHPWTVGALAAETGTSRSVLADRFAQLLGEPPLKYLARWRLQLAARMLETTSKAILQLASEVGYTSEAAFIRAFKREFGVPPGQYRRTATDQGAEQSPSH
jgi:AraC-like DNA-binding protein